MSGSHPRANDAEPPEITEVRSSGRLPARVASPIRTLLGGRFALLRPIGAGASGTVYEAFDHTHQARVALKLLAAHGGELLVRFKREFRALQTVRHPNVVSFGELFSDGDEWFFTMELLTGVDFRTYIRRAGAYDDARLRDSMRQVAEALAALHAAGIVHRDVKPANVMVTGHGRATLLDFGVVKDEASLLSTTDDVVSFVGTPAYMAPEQISGEAGPAADCYALGVMLYEALAGRFPFGGKVADVLRLKQTEVPPPPHAIDDRIPADLGKLAMDLLAIDPSARPSAAEIARRLSREPRATTSSSAPPSGRSSSFVGRGAELTELHERYAALATADGPVCVVVEGESGIGKSALVQRFLAEVKSKDPNALVLSSRCRETEWIPYKAFEGLIEGLSRFMRSLRDVDAALLLPFRTGLVAQVFPALMQVGSVALARTTPSAHDLDAVSQRRRLFAAVRELLARASQRYPLVLFVDDLQWADPDSLALLDEVLRGPEAPVLLLVVAVRGQGAPESSASRARWRAGAHRVKLGPLSEAHATELAERLARQSDATAALDARFLAREAEGHPLFIHELVVHAATHAPGSALHLDDALRARVKALEPEARELLEHLALAVRPLSRAALARASALDGNDAYRLTNLLVSQNLARVSGPLADGFEPFHDRVRQAVLRDLPPTRKTRRHRRLAAALESHGARDPEALAYHWRGAGKPERAATYAEQAAREAERAFAFDHAAHLYRVALDLGPPSMERRVALQAKLGDAFANGGRSVQAAGAYREAAAGARPNDALVYLQKAADQLLRAGRVEEGVVLANELQRKLGLPVPQTLWHALAWFLLWRFVLALRGVSFRERAASDIPPLDLAKIDVSWSITSGLSTVDPIRGAFFQAQHLRMALRAGEPYRVVRALALQVGYAAGPGAERWLRSERLAARCAALSERVGDPHGVGLTLLASGTAAYLHGRFERALTLLDEAEVRLRSTPGSWGEIARARRFALSALANLGRMRELQARVYAQLRDARAHGDVHATTNLRIGHPNLVWLMEDDVEAARAEIEGAMQEWSLPGFQLEHYYAHVAWTNVDLYAGDPARARARQLEVWPALERSFLLRIPAARVLTRSSRGRVAVALAQRTDRASSDALLCEAERLARRVAGEKLPWASATAELLRAGVASVRGNVELATKRLVAAERAFDALGMRLHAVAARRCRGELEGGASGHALVRDADDWMKNERIQNPERMASMLVPGFWGNVEHAAL